MLQSNLSCHLMMENSEKITFTTTNRGNRQLIYQNHLFWFNKKKPNGRSLWRCSKCKTEKCEAYLTTGPNDEFVRATEHNHGSNIPALKAKIQRIEALDFASKNPTLNPRRILGDLAANHPQDLNVSLEKSSEIAMSKAMRRARNKELGYPKLPQTFAEVQALQFPDRFSKTKAGDPFLVLKDFVTTDSENVMLLFLSPFGRQLLGTSTMWTSDGTFKTTVSPFKQIYIVYGITQEGQSLPAAYALLPSKEEEVYRRLWQQIEFEISQDYPDHSPEKVLMDFEQAASKTFAENFPDAEVVGCIFHFRKNFRHQLGKKGCLTLYDEDEDFQRIADQMCCLAYVPASSIVSYFETAIEPNIEKAEPDLPEAALDFFDYFVKTYIGRRAGRKGARRQPMFAHKMWSAFDQIKNGLATTNNAQEASNGVWNDNADTNKSLWSVINGFQREDALAKERFYRGIFGSEKSPTTSRALDQAYKVEALKKAAKMFGQVPAKEYLALVRKAMYAKRPKHLGANKAASSSSCAAAPSSSRAAAAPSSSHAAAPSSSRAAAPSSTRAAAAPSSTRAAAAASSSSFSDFENCFKKFFDMH